MKYCETTYHVGDYILRGSCLPGFNADKHLYAHEVYRVAHVGSAGYVYLDKFICAFSPADLKPYPFKVGQYIKVKGEATDLSTRISSIDYNKSLFPSQIIPGRLYCYNGIYYNPDCVEICETTETQPFKVGDQVTFQGNPDIHGVAIGIDKVNNLITVRWAGQWATMCHPITELRLKE